MAHLVAGWQQWWIGRIVDIGHPLSTGAAHWYNGRNGLAISLVSYRHGKSYMIYIARRGEDNCGDGDGNNLLAATSVTCSMDLQGLPTGPVLDIGKIGHYCLGMVRLSIGTGQ